MTILQIRIALLTAELGSISAAAKELSLSQPNASNSIRLLEEEVGFPIFERIKSGALLTDKGMRFMEYGQRILEQNDRIHQLRYGENVYRLHLGSTYYSTAIEPFFKLCADHANNPVADLCYYDVSVGKGMELLRTHDLDIVIAPTIKQQIAGLSSACKRENIVKTSIGQIPGVLILRREHPAVLDGRCENISQGSAALKSYPYIAYHRLSEDNSATGYHESDFIQCSHKIFVDRTDVRLRLLSTTNGFSLGGQVASGIREPYNLVTFPLKDICMEVFALTRPNAIQRAEIAEYLSLLRQELET